jgi:hypothetical protein
LINFKPDVETDWLKVEIGNVEAGFYFLKSSLFKKMAVF